MRARARVKMRVKMRVRVRARVRMRVEVRVRVRAGLACSRRAASYSLIGGHERAPPGWLTAVTSATLEAAGSSTRGSGGVPSGPASTSSAAPHRPRCPGEGCSLALLRFS